MPKHSNKHFGKDEIVIGGIYVMQDIVAVGKHTRRDHSVVRVKCVEVDAAGVLRVGVSFRGQYGDELDDLQFTVDPGCYCFPSMLRRV